MILDNLPVLDALRTKLTWLTQRQQVLAQNIANANTPDYRAQDLSEMNFDKFMRPQAPQPKSGATHSAHFAFGGAANPAMPEAEDSPGWETTADGNSVVLEEQMMKVAQTQMEYQSAISL